MNFFWYLISPESLIILLVKIPESKINWVKVYILKIFMHIFQNCFPEKYPNLHSLLGAYESSHLSTLLPVLKHSSSLS